MIRQTFKTIVRKDGEDYGAILNGMLHISPVPLILPTSVDQSVLLNLLIDEDKDLFLSDYCIIEVKVIPLEHGNIIQPTQVQESEA